MASRGFEFVGMVDGTNATPVIKDFILGAAAAHKVGDLVLMQSDGYVDQVTGTTTEVTGVMQEAFAAADVTAGTTKGKVAIITPNQIWRCSMDASSTSAVIGYTKTVDTADCNTIDADDLSNGAMIAYKVDDLDDEGNILAQVIFADTTFGNA
jgi:uncharacterized protein YpuA (DUF1002 family)